MTLIFCIQTLGNINKNEIYIYFSTKGGYNAMNFTLAIITHIMLISVCYFEELMSQSGI